MSDLSPREVIDRIARGLELTRKQFAEPKPTVDARRPARLVKRKKPRPQYSRSARSMVRTARRSHMGAPVVHRVSHAIGPVAGDKRLAADKMVERLLLSLKEEREALVVREHAESVARSRRAVYFVLTFAAGVIAGALMMKELWPRIQI